MSELKVYRNPKDRPAYREFYEKSEADKVIEELKKERDWLAKDRAQAYDDLEKRAQLNIKQESEIEELKEQVHDYALGSYVMQARAEKEARHYKFKRCLAMAKWCGSKVYNIRRTPLSDMSEHEYWQYENDFWQRWQKRWLELSYKFKDGV